MTTKAYLSKNIAVLAGLKALKANGPENRCGICSNAAYYAIEAGHYTETIALDAVRVVSDWAKDWPKYSGSECYPVPDPEVLVGNFTRAEGADRAAKIYDDAYGGRWDGEYGDLRRELLDFLIEVIEEFVETNK